MRNKKNIGMKETLKTIAKQIDYEELHMAGFKLVFSNEENYIAIRKGYKRLEIKYNSGMDDYTVTKQTFNRKYGYGNGIDYKEEVLNNIYWDQLKGIIEDFFNFEYILKSTMRGWFK